MQDLTNEQTEQLAQKIAKYLVISCDCGLSKEAQAEMPHLLGMVKDIGGNDYGSGVEVLRDMGKRYSRMSKISDYISRAIMLFFLVSLFTGLGCLLKAGVSSFFKLGPVK